MQQALTGNGILSAILKLKFFRTRWKICGDYELLTKGYYDNGHIYQPLDVSYTYYVPMVSSGYAFMYSM